MGPAYQGDRRDPRHQDQSGFSSNTPSEQPYNVVWPTGEEVAVNIGILREWAQEGRITAETALRDNNTGNLLRAGDLLSLQSLLGQSHRPPPIAPRPVEPTVEPVRANNAGQSGVAVFLLLIGLWWLFFGGGLQTLGITSPPISDEATMSEPYATAPTTQATPSMPTLASPTIPSQIPLILIKQNVVAHGQLGRPALTGEAKSPSGAALDYVEAKAEFYDGNGQIVATQRTNDLGIGAGQIWRFEVMWPTDVDAKTGKFVEVIGKP